MKTLYHYTHHKALLGILKEGNIKLATASAEKTKPIAWLSTNKDFEPTALKGWFDEVNNQRGSFTLEQQFEKFGLARI